MTLYVAPIVEGQTEFGCLETLLQRVWVQLLQSPVRMQVLLPSRDKRASLVHPAPNMQSLNRKVEEAFGKLAQRIAFDPGSRGLLLILLDSEKDCPAELGPKLLSTARAARSDADIACVLAKRMFENWIVGGASTLAGIKGLPKIIPARSNVEECSGASWLNSQIRKVDPTRIYKKTAYANAFVKKIDLHECRANCPSFDKLCRELQARVPPMVPIVEPENPEAQLPLQPDA